MGGDERLVEFFDQHRRAGKIIADIDAMAEIGRLQRLIEGKAPDILPVRIDQGNRQSDFHRAGINAIDNLVGLRRRRQPGQSPGDGRRQQHRQQGQEQPRRAPA